MFASSFVSASDVADLYRAKMKHFIDDMPKVELHIHLEGTMNPETVAKLATRNEFDYFNTEIGRAHV